MIFFIILLSNVIVDSDAGFWSNSMNLIFTSILLIGCIVNNFKIGLSGKHGKSWLFFTFTIVFWYLAERIWTMNNLVISNDFSYADLFWFTGYVFYFLFGIMYLKPFASQISKRNILVTSLVVLTVMVLVFYTISPQTNISENMLNSSYPIIDAIMLIPSILGIMLFFKGNVKLSWSLLFFGMLIFVIADYGFMYFDSLDEYYEGHLIDIPYLWAYAIFIGGVIANLSIWRTNKSKPFVDQDNLR